MARRQSVMLVPSSQTQILLLRILPLSPTPCDRLPNASCHLSSRRGFLHNVLRMRKPKNQKQLPKVM